jgi:hypothetical protein
VHDTSLEGGASFGGVIIKSTTREGTMNDALRRVCFPWASKLCLTLLIRRKEYGVVDTQKG